MLYNISIPIQQLKIRMKSLFNMILILILFIEGESVLGIDASQLYSKKIYQCIKDEGYQFAILRGYRSYGAVDGNAVQGLINAKSTGLITDIYMFPCRGKCAEAQVDQMMNKIPNNLYGMVWLDVQTNISPKCKWTDHDVASNCQFIANTIKRIKYHGKQCGIYTNRNMWERILGDRYACSQVAEVQLWYAHYDKSPQFSDFQAFGGWTSPNIKQYQGDTTVCGVGVDKNYY